MSLPYMTEIWKYVRGLDLAETSSLRISLLPHLILQISTFPAFLSKASFFFLYYFHNIFCISAWHYWHPLLIWFLKTVKWKYKLRAKDKRIYSVPLNYNTSLLEVFICPQPPTPRVIHQMKGCNILFVAEPYILGLVE